MVIYKLTNKTNSKSYIGQTIGNVKKRWTTHFAKSSGCVAINAALRKYGKDGFEFKIVDTASSIDELNEKEEMWIEKENSLSPNGYNLTKGGNNRQLSEDSKERIRESRRYQYEPIICLNNGKRYDNMSIAARDLNLHPNEISYVANGKTDSAKGMKFEFLKPELRVSAEKRRRDRQIKTKESRAKGQEIICLENEKLYKTIKAAAEDLGIHKRDISAFLSGYLVTAKGYTFKYVNEEKNTKRQLIRELKKDGKIRGAIKGGEIISKSIICVELNKTYKSITMASKELNIHKSSIQNMLAERSRTAGGYTFKYS